MRNHDCPIDLETDDGPDNAGADEMDCEDGLYSVNSYPDDDDEEDSDMEFSFEEVQCINHSNSFSQKNSFNVTKYMSFSSNKTRSKSYIKLVQSLIKVIETTIIF